MRCLLFALGFAALAASSIQAANVAAGKAAYDKSCKSCHGADGTANPAVAKMMKVEIHDLKSPEVQGMSDADLEKVITEGKGKMHAVPAAANSAPDIVAYIRAMKK
jgi:mono/diheme cytochrome c family protein